MIVDFSLYEQGFKQKLLEQKQLCLEDISNTGNNIREFSMNISVC